MQLQVSKIRRVSSVDVGGGRTSIGRSSENDLVLPHTSVSRQHCVIELVDGSPVLRDLKSRHGTRVNGRRVTRSPLGDGDTIGIGPFKITFVDAGRPRSLGPGDTNGFGVEGEVLAGGAAALNGESAADDSAAPDLAIEGLEHPATDSGEHDTIASAGAAAELEEARAALEAARGDRSALRKKLESARAELLASRGEVEATRGDLEQTRRELETLRSELDTSGGELGSARDELDRARAALEQTGGELTAARDTVAHQEAELAAAQRRQAQGDERITALEAEQQRLRRELDARTQRLEEAVDLSASLQERIRSLETSQQHAAQRAAVAEHALVRFQGLTRELREASGRVSATMRGLRMLEVLWSEANDQVDEADQTDAETIAYLSEQRDRVSERLEAAHAERDTMLADLQAMVEQISRFATTELARWQPMQPPTGKVGRLLKPWKRGA